MYYKVQEVTDKGEEHRLKKPESIINKWIFNTLKTIKNKIQEFSLTEILRTTGSALIKMVKSLGYVLVRVSEVTQSILLQKLAPNKTNED